MTRALEWAGARARRTGAFLMVLGFVVVLFSVVAPTAGAVDHPEHCGEEAAATTPSHAPGSTNPDGGNRPGNNGTVKIDGCELDQGRGPANDKPGNGDPDNEPHIGCLVTVDWYNYDEDTGDDELFSSVLFEVWPPTSTGTAVTVPVVAHRAPGNGHAPFDGTAPYDSDDDVYIGEDPASGAGAEGLDASVTYRMDEVLAAFEAHPQHGWHVKLTINAEGSQGADVKHKVFWTGPCEDTTATTTTSTTSTSTTSTSSTSTTSTSSTSTTSTTLGGSTTTIGGSTTTIGGQSFPNPTTTAPSPPTSGVLGTSVENTTTTAAPGPAGAALTSTTAGSEVAGVQITQGPAVQGVQLARTGDDTRTAVFLAGLALLLGGAAIVAGDKLVSGSAT